MPGGPPHRHSAQRRGLQHVPFMRTGELPPPRWTAQVVLPSQQLVGHALCRAEPSITGGWQDPQVKAPVRRPPRAWRPTKWPAACAVLDLVPGENTRGARRS